MYTKFGSRTRAVLIPLTAPTLAAIVATKTALTEEKQQQQQQATKIKGGKNNNTQHGRQVVWMFGDRSSIPYGAGADLTRPTPIEWFSRHDCMWKQVAIGTRFGAARDDKGKVYIWGQKKVADLPEAEKRRLKRMELPLPEGKYVPPFLLKALEGYEPITDIQVSEDRLFILTSRGKVLTWSIEELLDSVVDDDKGTAAAGTTEPQEFDGLPTLKWWWLPRSWGNAIRYMSVGRRHAGFIDDYGHTYMVGDNTFGQCGRKIKAKNVNPEDGTLMPIVESRDPPDWFGLPAKPLTSVPGKATQVSCGGRHSMVLGEDGRVWAFGDDSRIQLALGDTRSKPQDMMGPGKKGWDNLYNMGDEKMYKLGDNPHAPRVQYSYYDPHCQWRPKLTQPPPPRSGKPFTSPLWIHLGNKISVFCHEDEPDWASKRPPSNDDEGLSVLDEEKARRSKDVECNILFACGENLYGECGRNTQRHQQGLYPVRLPKFTKVEEVQCGSQHCLCRLSDGTVYTWGRNQQGQGGVGNRATVCPPAAVLGSRQRGPLRRDVETNDSTARKEAHVTTKHVSDTSYISFDEKDMIPIPEEQQTWRQRVEARIADLKHIFVTEPSMPDLEKKSKPSEHTGPLEKAQLTTEEQMPWRPVHVAAGGNSSAIIAVWEQSVADAINEEKERQMEENAQLIAKQMEELKKRKDALAAAGITSTGSNNDDDA